MKTEDINLQVHNLPAVVMLECQLPEKLINDLNEYLDEYKEDKCKTRYSWGGDILSGIPMYIKMVKHINMRDK